MGVLLGLPREIEERVVGFFTGGRGHEVWYEEEEGQSWFHHKIRDEIGQAFIQARLN
jgi:hypothetical protein